MLAAALAFASASAQDMSPEQMARFRKMFFRPQVETIKLYESDGPIRGTEKDMDFTEAILQIYRPAEPNGICVLECPGGGYATLSITHEGREFSTWFNLRGITYCVLQYRLPNHQHDVPLSDAEAAMKYLKAHANELGINKIGVMGCSAGGHLASTLATHYSSPETRPDFQILLYPVITMDASYTHMSSREFLLGENPSQELIDLYSNEKHVTSQTPAAFIVLTSTDFLVPVKNSTTYYEELVKNRVSATLMCYPEGNHGFGISESFRYKSDWLKQLETWIDTTVK